MVENAKLKKRQLLKVHRMKSHDTFSNTLIIMLIVLVVHRDDLCLDHFRATRVVELGAATSEVRVAFSGRVPARVIILLVVAAAAVPVGPDIVPTASVVEASVERSTP